MKTAFANGDKSWEESDNLVASLAGELSKLGHPLIARDSYIQLEDFTLWPQIVNVRIDDHPGRADSNSASSTSPSTRWERPEARREPTRRGLSTAESRQWLPA